MRMPEKERRAVRMLEQDILKTRKSIRGEAELVG
jgi:hypothetical protein